MSQDPNQEPLVRLDVSGGLAIVTLNRPRAYNAINLLLAESLVDILIRCDEDRQVRAVLVTGAGPAFCSGGDIRQMQEYVARDGDGGRFLKSLTVYLHAAITTISHMQKPVVMAVNGPAAGAGFSLAIAGDLLLHPPDEVIHFPLAGAHRAVNFEVHRGGVGIQEPFACRISGRRRRRRSPGGGAATLETAHGNPR